MEIKLDDTFTCELCNTNEINISELFIITDECKHQMCKTCAKNHINMNKHNNRHAVCPFDNCNQSIPDNKLKEILSEDEFTKYENILFYNFDLLQLNNDDEIIMYCFTPDCTYAALVSRNDDCFECELCNNKYCIKCQMDITNKEHAACDINNITTDFDQLNLESKTLQILANEFNQVYGYARCPHCRNGVDKTEGCNHISCKCGNHFCYKCNSVIDPSNLYDHFNDDHPMVE